MAKPISVQMNRFVWVFTFVVATVYFFTGMTKVVGAEYQVAMFAGWHLPVWFMYLVGIYETVLALLMMVKPVVFWATIGLAVEMLGAIVVHLVAGEASMIIFPGLMIALLGLIFFSRMPPRLADRLDLRWHLGHAY